MSRAGQQRYVLRGEILRSNCREIFTTHRKFSAALTQRNDITARDVGILCSAALPDKVKQRKRNLQGQNHRMIAHRTNPLQRSEVSTVTDSQGECNVVSSVTLIFKPISLESTKFVIVENDYICLMVCVENVASRCRCWCADTTACVEGSLLSGDEKHSSKTVSVMAVHQCYTHGKRL